MPSECPVCHAVAVDPEPGGELVCHECGAVVESRVFNFENDRDGWTLMSANGTARFGGRYDLPISMRLRLPTGDSSVTKKRLQFCLYSQVKRLNLSNEILNEARELLFDRVVPMRSSKEVEGLSSRRNLLTGSCLFIVCRQNNIHLTYRHMAAVAECNMFQLGRCVKMILKALDIKLDPLSVESLIPCVLSELSVLDNSCEKLALDLCKIFQYFGLSLAGSQTVRAVNFVLLVLECKKMSPTKNKIAEVLGKNSLKERQLRGAMSRMKVSLLELAKEVPWIPQSVKKRDIAKHLIDIVNFHEKCGKLDLSVVKTMWMKKKEIADNNRKVKIQKAKSRILGKEHAEPGGSTSSETTPSPQNCHSLTEHEVSGCHGNGQESDKAVALQSFPPQEVSAPPSTDGINIESVEASDSNHNAGLTSCNDHDLDDNDMLIENLLKCGYSEEELMDGYFESRMCDLQSSQELDVEGEREDLDELDIADREMHHYLWSVAEMERLKNLKN